MSTPVDPSLLKDRFAHCYCGRQEPSSAALAFFRYRGPGSYDALHSCGVCRYFDTAHDPEIRQRPHMWRAMKDGHEFVPIGDQPDVFYCGCRGWD